ncbi:MAG: signal recognition particle-docking protein FtsY [Bacteroidetes Order II. Incertae sedis bacterium]|nr:signal recognition particle-docking protein FtsY [Bacteroidetes Order II. bacterium]
MGFFDRFKKRDNENLEQGLEKTRTSFLGKLNTMIRGKDKVDEEVLDELEGILVTSDVGVKTTIEIIQKIEERVARDKYVNTADLNGIIRSEVAELLLGSTSERPADFEAPLPHKPHVIMVVGVNGVGKTTSIGKMAYRYKEAGKQVVLGAADTFRAAATEQLGIWADRVGVPIIKQGQGADPAAVAFDTLASAKKQQADVVLIDTAGRLHNKGGLMDELSKVKRVMDRQIPGAPHEVLLVLDASVGQNALRQAEEFTKSVEVTGLVLTKLDGTAKGGIVICISNEFNVPVKYIGVGEKVEDLQVFDKRTFVEKIFV